MGEEQGTADIGAVQARVAQVCSEQVGEVERGVAKVCADEQRAPQVRVVESQAVEVGAGQVTVGAQPRLSAVGTRPCPRRC